MPDEIVEITALGSVLPIPAKHGMELAGKKAGKIVNSNLVRRWHETGEHLGASGGGQSRVLKLFTLVALNAIHSVCGTPAFKGSKKSSAPNSHPRRFLFQSASSACPSCFHRSTIISRNSIRPQPLSRLIPSSPNKRSNRNHPTLRTGGLRYSGKLLQT